MKLACMMIALSGCQCDRAEPRVVAPPPEIRDPAPAPPKSGGPPPYQLVARAAPARAGAPATVRISITPAAEHHMNPDYPDTALAIAPPAGVAARPARRVTSTERELAFEVAITATAAGAYHLGGEVKFAVCTESRCLPQTQPLDVAVDVQ